jgi:hypothetical protein
MTLFISGRYSTLEFETHYLQSLSAQIWTSAKFHDGLNSHICAGETCANVHSRDARKGPACRLDIRILREMAAFQP